MRELDAEPLRAATLQHVLDALDAQFAAGEIGAIPHRDARSGVLSYCRAAGKLKADIVELLERMDETSAIKAGFMPDRWSNLKSLLRRALNLAGNETKPARRDRPVAPPWDRLLRTCGDRDVAIRLQPFAGYCTDRHIDPPAVDEAVLEGYADEVRLIARSKNPTDAVKKVRRCWNKLVKAFPDELTFKCQERKGPRGWSLSLDLMPQAFQREMALFREARSPETYEKHFRCKPLKNRERVKQQCQLIMRFVTAMHKNGHALSNFKSFQYLVQPEFFRDTIECLKQQTGAKNLNQLGAYAATIHWLAETWLRVRGARLRKLKELIANVGFRPVELAQSTIDVLDQFDDPKKCAKAKRLAEDVFNEFRAKAEIATRRDAAAFRDALFWELGLTSGWRPGTRARLSMDDHIRWSGRKSAPVATLVMPAEAEKTKLYLRVELPPSTSLMLRHYIRHALPLLRVSGDDNNPFLFPGRFGGHLERDGLSRGSRRLIALRTGIVGVTSHKSRHVGVKLHLAENPGDYETAREHTGHRDVDTTKRIYAMVNQVAASKRVHKSMGKY